uniref:Uncharacterized protein n=1 Tax=Zea mays TaxID=4577 RepID=A0A804MLS0_MAIZE
MPPPEALPPGRAQRKDRPDCSSRAPRTRPAPRDPAPRRPDPRPRATPPTEQRLQPRRPATPCKAPATPCLCATPRPCATTDADPTGRDPPRRQAPETDAHAPRNHSRRLFFIASNEASIEQFLPYYYLPPLMAP